MVKNELIFICLLFLIPDLPISCSYNLQLLKTAAHHIKRGGLVYRHDTDNTSSVLLALSEREIVICIYYKTEEYYKVIIEMINYYSSPWKNQEMCQESSERLYTLLANQSNSIVFK